VAAAVAAAVTLVATPIAARLGRARGLVAQPSDRGLHETPTPYLGGPAMLLGALVAAAIFLPGDAEVRALMVGCIAIVIVGVIDDIYDLHPGVKLLGQVGAALIPVLLGVRVEDITLPFVGNIEFGAASVPLTVLGMVALMNVVNFSDGIDGLAAGICAIAAITFVVIALSFKDPRFNAAFLAAITAGICIGFLPHNFNPASIFMGDSGANLLGMLLAGAAVQGLLKTTAVLALVLPLVLLAVPIFDTGMVVARRVRNRTAFYRPDREHFHHRLAALGFSQRRTVLILYAWSAILALFALALVFVPARENNVIQPGWLAVLVLFALVALAATVYVANLLGILHWGRFRTPEDEAQNSDF
jgi:UDP-GlcNAc:undecaprenyl-phosphate GlcNAc-1-phosphate transferase